MWSLSRPTPETVREFLAAQQELAFTYDAIGATATTPPNGYNVDRTRARLGEGREVFENAKLALRRWEHFRLGWVEPGSCSAPLEKGIVVAVVAHLFGGWWLNACRIVYEIDESGPVARFGFAYGTLPGHAESGEERFLLEWDRANDGVWYDIVAFSKPRHVLARLGYPVVRRIQKQFGRESAAAMQRAVKSAGTK